MVALGTLVFSEMYRREETHFCCWGKDPMQGSGTISIQAIECRVELTSE